MVSESAATDTKRLLWVVELGGYPDFTPLYRRLGFAVETVNSGRKAQAALKKSRPAVVVAEFNVQPAFRDRTSNLESLLAATQRMPETRVIAFYEGETEPQLSALRARFPHFTALSFPIDEASLEEALGSVGA